MQVICDSCKQQFDYIEALKIDFETAGFTFETIEDCCLCPKCSDKLQQMIPHLLILYEIGVKTGTIKPEPGDNP